MARKDRLKEVYEYVRSHFPIHTQVDFADKLKYNRAYISSAMHGNEKNLTDKLFRNICEAFPGVFDLDYLLTGKGALLTIEEEVHSEDIKKAATPSNDDMTANILEVYARMIRGLDDLRIQIKSELEEVKTIKDELQQARDDFRDATYRLTRAIDRLNSSGNAHTIGFAAED